MTSSPVCPVQLIQKALTTKGFDLVSSTVLVGDMLNTAIEVAESYSDWEQGIGFGSSDFTYALKSFLDDVINNNKLDLGTVFNPYLSIIKQ